MKKILVTGNPRSGTLSMKNMLRAAGFDVQHERQGKDGTVSCFFLTNIGKWPREKGTARRHMNADGTDEVFELADINENWQRYLLVRDPRKCIPSMAKIVGVGHRMWLHGAGIVDSTVKPKMLWSALAWLKTNQHIEAIFMKPRVLRIEKIKTDWPKKFGKFPGVIHQHRGSGTRKAEPITFDQLNTLMSIAGYKKEYEELRDMARRYGY